MASLTIGVAFQIFTAAAAAVSLAISLSSMGQAGNFGQSDLGQSISRKGKDDPRIVPFGKSIIPAVKVFSNVNDQDKKFFTHVYSLGHGPFKSIQQVYVDGQSVFPVQGNDYSEQWYSGSSLAQGFENLQIGVRRGTLVGSAWPQVIANSDGMWSTSHRGDGIASLSLLVERPDLKGKSDSPYRIMTDRITLTALCEGIAVIDPRTDPLLLGSKDKSKRTHTSFRNPITCLLTYLLDEEFGLRLDPSMVDLNSFINTANWCDANQIYLDGYVDQGDTFATILNKFSSAFGGHIYLESGKIKVSPESSSPVLFNIKEEDLIGNMSLTNNKGDYYNTIKIDFQNKNTDFDKDSFVLPKDAIADERIREDGRIFDKSMDCPLSTDPEYIKGIANRELKRSLLCRKEMTLTVNNTQYNLKMGNVFTLTNSLYQLDTSTKWRVTKLETSLDEKVLETKVTAVQYDERIYDSTSYDDGNLSSSLPRPNFIVLPVTNLKFIQNNTLAVGSGTLTFESQYQGDARFRIQYKLSSSSVWTQYGEYPFDSVNIVGLQTGVNYDFKVQCVASIGASAWTSISNVRVNRSISLPAVTGLAVNFTSPDCVITFNPINGAISNTSVVGDNLTNLSQLVHYYEISVKHGAAGTAKNYRTTTPQFIYPFDENSKRGLSRSLNITVRAISIYGDAGVITSISAANAPMAQPSGVLVDAQLKSLTVTWDNPSEPSLGILDYDSTDIYLVPTAQTVVSDQYLIATSSHGSFTKLMPDSQKTGFIRIAHRDKFGHTSPITASPAYLYTQTTIDDLITDSEFESNFKELEDAVSAAEAELIAVNSKIDANKAEIDSKVAAQQVTINAEKTKLTNTVTDLNKAKTDILKNATDIQTNKTTIASQGARITTVEQTASDNTGSIATLTQRIEAVNDDLSAEIETNTTAIATANSSMAAIDTRLTAATNKNTADIATNKTSITTTNSALTALDTRLTAKTNTNTADISSNKTAIAASDKALADYKLVVSSDFATANGRIDTVSSSLSTLEGTVATQGTAITANYNNLNGKITTTNATVTSQGTAIANLDSSLATFKTSTGTNFANANARIDTVQTTATNTDQALATFKTSTNASLTNTNSRIDTTNTNLATTNSALTALDTRLTAKTNTNAATITSQGTAISNLDSALSTYKTSNNAEVAGVKASVTTVSTAQATTAGKVSSMYGLRVDANGKVAGMTLNAANNSTSIDFLADSFRVASATTGTAVTAFEVRSGSVYVRNALIGSLTASQISADAINGNHIASNSIIVAGSGATSATLNGSDATWRIYAGSAAPASAPFRVSTTGGLVATNANITGAITATSGSFNGTITAQGGSFASAVYCGSGNSAYISGHAQHHFLQGPGGKFVVDRNGNLSCSDATIRGTLYAEDIRGDVTNLIRPSGSFAVASYGRNRNIVCINGITGSAVISGSGTIGITVICRMNGTEIERNTVSTTYPTGINRVTMSAALQPAFVIPANTYASITFEVIAYGTVSAIEQQTIGSKSIWLMGLY